MIKAFIKQNYVLGDLYMYIYFFNAIVFNFILKFLINSLF